MGTSPRHGSIAVVLLASLAASAWLAPSASAADGKIVFNERFYGLIDSALDQDTVEFDEAAGSKLKIVVTAQSGNGLKPFVELLDESQTPIDVGSALKLKGKTASISGFEAPYSGTYSVRVSSNNQLTGTYKVKVTGSLPSKVKLDSAVGAPGEIDDVPFASRVDGTVSGTIKRVSGDFVPHIVQLVGPGGTLVAVAGKSTLAKGDTQLKIASIKLPLLGAYSLKVTGLSGTTGSYSVNLKVTQPKPLQGKVYEEGHPQDNGSGGGTITLQDVFFARGLRGLDGLSIAPVSPYSLVQTDPISNLPIPGTLKALFESVDLSKLVSFNLGPIYGPPIVPRNAVVVLRFDKKPSLESLNLDEDRLLTDDSPIRITVNDVSFVTEVFVDGKDVILNPVYGEEVGFPPSPVAFDSLGNPAADVLGSGKLSLLSKGDNVIESTEGGTYKARGDLLGSPDAGGEPIGFNPGNQVLDFFNQSSVGAGAVSFGGFLPDDKAPRLIREFPFDHVFAPDILVPTNGDFIGPKLLSLHLDHAFNTSASAGLGEWAQGVLRLRPDGPNPEAHIILQNTVIDLGNGFFRNDILLATSIVIPLGDGEPLQLVRAEYFEPDLNDPIDATLFDIDNPELVNNTDILRFVEAIDRNGDLQDLTSSLDPRTKFRFRFNEPMAVETFRVYESFYISDSPQIGNFGINYIGAVGAVKGGQEILFLPDRPIQFGPLAGTTRLVGLKQSSLLDFHLKVVPTRDVLEGIFGTNGVEDFLAEGHRGLTDLGGQPLAFPKSLLGPQGFVDYKFTFATGTDAQLTPHGAVVQRFLGTPETGFDGLGNTGVTYRDVPPELCGEMNNLYGPRIADVNLFTNGFLSGAPVQFFTKIHDDFNPPPTGQFSPFPFGTSTPIGGFAVLGGARFQHVFRAVDASPDWEALAGTNLDLRHIAYAPIGGFVTDTVLPDISIHAGHSAVVPDTAQSGGIPSHQASGLKEVMNNNYDAIELGSGVVHQRQLVAGTDDGGGSYTGVQFQISNNHLFTPIGTQRNYHPIPDQPFQFPFPYNNGSKDQKKFAAPDYGGAQVTWGGVKNDPRPESLLLEYRVRVVDAENPPSASNGFTFSVGILSSALPRFRVFTIGVGCLSCCFSGSGGCQNNCLIQYGPPLDGVASGPLLDPDSIVKAAGPAPAPPGMQCKCLKAATNPLPPPAGCADQGPTGATQTIDMVALGAAQPSGNNYGDNSRYFMVFNYVKRESYIRSPFISVQPSSVTAPTYLDPVFDPPLDEVPVGTVFDIRFRSSPSGGAAGGDASAWVTPIMMVNTNNPLNALAVRPYIQFETRVQANTSTQLTPIFDEIVVPFRQ